MREALANTSELTRRLDDLEQRLESRLEKHDDAITDILRAIRALMTPHDSKRRPIGFVGAGDEGS
jgi:ATP-dependent Clp protease ATP-binding subunit ClpA